MEQFPTLIQPDVVKSIKERSTRELTIEGLHNLINAKETPFYISKRKNLIRESRKVQNELLHLCDDSYKLEVSFIERNLPGVLNFTTEEKIVSIDNDHEFTPSINQAHKDSNVRVIPPINLNMACVPRDRDNHNSSNFILFTIPGTDKFMIISFFIRPSAIFVANDPKNIFGGLFYKIDNWEMDGVKFYRPGKSFLSAELDTPDIKDDSSWDKIIQELNSISKAQGLYNIGVRQGGM